MMNTRVLRYRLLQHGHVCTPYRGYYWSGRSFDVGLRCLNMALLRWYNIIVTCLRHVYADAD